MNTYLIILAILFAFLGGHALARAVHGREWFYNYAFPVFTVSASLVGLAAILQAN